MAIIKEKNPKKITKDGRAWYFDLYYINEYGESKEKQSKMFKTKKEAQEAQEIFLTLLKENKTQNENVSFTQVYSEWLNFKSKQFKPTTDYGYGLRANKHILKFFKDYKLHNININTINKWCNTMINKDLELSYVNQIIGYLKDFLEFAVDFYDFNSKVYTYLQPYKLSSSDKIKNSEWNFWTYNEWLQFISVVDDEYYRLMFNFLYFTGWRLGEVIGFCWKNFDEDNHIAKVRKTFTVKVKNEKWALVDPKTKNSIRDTDLDDELYDMLMKHYKNEKNIYGFNEEMFVFGNVKHVAEETFRRHLNKYIKLSGVKKITPHGFRHSHVSFLINVLNLSIFEVANRIGDTPQEVERTYYHMFPEKKKNVINKLNEFKKRENNEVNTR